MQEKRNPYNYRKDLAREYYLRNRDRIIEYNKRRYQEDSINRRIYAKEYYETNKEEILKKAKIYRDKIREERSKESPEDDQGV